MRLQVQVSDLPVVHELPAGLSFIAGAYKEAELFALAYAFEQATKKRMAPKFLKTGVA